MSALGKPKVGRALARPLPQERFKATRAVPTPVRVAAYLKVGLAGLQLILLAVLLTSFDWNGYVADSVGPFDHDGTELQVTPATAVGTAIARIALNALGIALTVVLALRALRGANWARISISVFFGLSIVSMIGFAFDYVALGAGVIDLVAVVLLWLPTSNEFFRAVRLDRLAHRSKQLV
jgi:hypothetical protein